MRTFTTIVTICELLSSSAGFAHEIGQRIGGFASTQGETRSMARMSGRADSPMMASGSLQTSISLNADIERVRVEDDAKTKYMSENFPEGQRLDRDFGVDNTWTVDKRTELTIGGNVSGDGITSSSSKRASAGHWLLGDQLRVGVFGATAETKRPPDFYLDYDSSTIVLKERVITESGGISFKAIVNPTTILSADYSQIHSTERPVLRAWSVGARQFIAPCDCAIHADVARVVNLGSLNTNMSSGELTGSQWSVAYLQSLWRDGHARIAYRFAREDEFKRAYGDHYVFGSDSYTAAMSHEFQKARVQGAERPLLVDVAATRYIGNRGAAATTMEMGAGVKF